MIHVAAVEMSLAACCIVAAAPVQCPAIVEHQQVAGAVRDPDLILGLTVAIHKRANGAISLALTFE